MYANVYTRAYVWLRINEMNDSSNTKDRRKELGIVSYYKVLALPVGGIMLFESGFGLAVNSRPTTKKSKRERSINYMVIKEIKYYHKMLN